ncbi:hypothetical protein [Propionispira raffinosivorans]|uniref:hypothetical protein n=1 Tax=Propionispira raffinosivorans TaxID=86959 RepID=UPI0012B53C34|nr:hypothetical protein [Propionispira raffinosivorans]
MARRLPKGGGVTAAMPWQSRSLTMFPSSQFGFYGRHGLVVAAWEGRFLPLLGG